MGPAVSVGPGALITSSAVSVDQVQTTQAADMRDVTPADLLTVNTAVMEDPVRRLILRDMDWLTRDKPQAAVSR